MAALGAAHHTRLRRSATVMNTPEDSIPNHRAAAAGEDLLAWLLGAGQLALAVGTSLAVLVNG
jgi:hypothetical protein